jgi:iron(III) transport system ATP-binding protein
MNPVILRLQNTTMQYSQAAAPVISDVSLSLEQDEVIALLGPSGCGKTTLLRLIAGFELPQRGSIEIAGRVVANGKCWVPPEQRQVGIVFQDYALFSHMTVGENIAFGLRSPHERFKSLPKEVFELLTLIGLEGLEQRYPHELSGGQQQRVALARALAPQPQLILLDEPLSNLDVGVRLRLREEVREILKTTGTSAIFVTHDHQEAFAIADRIAILHQGKLVQLTTPEMIYRQPASRFVAEFITHANFLPAHRRDQGWETEVGYFEHQDMLFIDTETSELMIHEEDLMLQEDPQGTVIIKSRCFLGRKYRYCLQSDSGRTFYACTPLSTSFPAGTRVRLFLAAD